MAAQKGREILLKMDTASSGGPTYTTVGGVRSKTLTVNRETVDVTNSDSTGMWRELLADGGVRSMSVSGSGVFVDDPTINAVLTQIVSGTTNKSWELTVPGLGVFVGTFAVTSCELGGEYNGEVSDSISLESAGSITYTPGA